MKLLQTIPWFDDFVYYKLISDITVNDHTTKKVLQSSYIFENLFILYLIDLFTP